MRAEETRPRCPWPGKDPLYLAYHDDEWGVPEWQDRALFEKLVLDGFQAGLSWITVLRKRDAFRRAFDGFDPERIAGYGPAKLRRLMADARIIRNRAKIQATVANAKGYQRIQAETGSFARFLWNFVDFKPRVNRWRRLSQLPAETAESRTMSRALRERGFAFVGPTITYAFMQAVGMVNDHLVTCFRHADLAASPPRAPAAR